MTPDHIDPDTCPDGIVVQIRRVTDGQLLRETHLREINHIDAAVADDHDATFAEDAVILTFYDGDTGQKMDVPAAFILAMKTSFGVQSLEDWEQQRRT